MSTKLLLTAAMLMSSAVAYAQVPYRSPYVQPPRYREPLPDRAPLRDPAAVTRQVAPVPPTASRSAVANLPEPWRYVYYGDRWWYYTPQNNWMYFGSGAWYMYDPAASAMTRRDILERQTANQGIGLADETIGRGRALRDGGTLETGPLRQGALGAGEALAPRTGDAPIPSTAREAMRTGRVDTDYSGDLTSGAAPYGMGDPRARTRLPQFPGDPRDSTQTNRLRNDNPSAGTLRSGGGIYTDQRPQMPLPSQSRTPSTGVGTGSGSSSNVERPNTGTFDNRTSPGLNQPPMSCNTTPGSGNTGALGGGSPTTSPTSSGTTGGGTGTGGVGGGGGGGGGGG